MARAYGANTKLSGALETEYGTPPAQGVYLQLPFVSMTYGSEQGLLPSDLLGQGRDPLQPSRDVIRVDGDLVAPVDLRYFGYYLKCLFGAPVTTEGVGGDAGKFTHVFKSGAAAVPSMAMELGFPEVPAFFTKVGTVFDAMQIPFARSGNANATFTLIGQGETKASASAVGEVNSLPITRFSQFQGYVKKGATLLGNLTAASLGYSNKCERVETIRPDGKIEGADPAGATLTGNITVRFADTVLIDAATDGTPISLEFGYQIDADRFIKFEAHEIYLPKPKLPVSGPGGIEASFEYQGAKASDAPNRMLTVTLKNDVSEY